MTPYCSQKFKGFNSEYELNFSFLLQKRLFGAYMNLRELPALITHWSQLNDCTKR